MPVPEELQSSIYHYVDQYPLDIRVKRKEQNFGQSASSPYNPQNPAYDVEAVKKRKTTSSKTFLAYLEVGMQAKHDQQMRNYCKTNNIVGRVKDGSQVPNDDSGNPFAFYIPKGLVASEVVAKIMQTKWASSGALATGGTNDTIFVPGKKNMPGVQSKTQRDGYAYDISFWYMGTEIYVSFHCYPD